LNKASDKVSQRLIKAMEIGPLLDSTSVVLQAVNEWVSIRIIQGAIPSDKKQDLQNLKSSSRPDRKNILSF
jgi:hypothetical protein